MPPRKVPVHPATAAADAVKAAKAAASRKAQRAPHRLTDAEVQLLPGKMVLELGNAGHLKHLGVGIAPLKPAAAGAVGPKATTGKSAPKRGTRKSK